MPSMPPAIAERWMSPPRFSVYLHAAAGDASAALDLYDWNAAVTAACFRDFGHFEVLLRNRYAEKLDTQYSDWTSPSSALWTRQNGIHQTQVEQAKANRHSRQTLQTAYNRATVKTPGHILANLTFGFWANFTTAPRTSTIWSIVNPVFPGLTRGQVHDPIVRLNTFRNRLAHSEPVFSTTTGLAQRLTEFDHFLNQLDTSVATWVGDRSEVLSLLRAQPAGVHIVTPNYLGHTP